MHVVMMILKNQNVLFISFSIRVYQTKLMIDRFTDLVLYNCMSVIGVTVSFHFCVEIMFVVSVRYIHL